MQRKRGKKSTRCANTEEKRFHAALKWRPCSVCGVSAPSEVDHIQGSTFKHNKELIGHWLCQPLCTECHRLISTMSRRRFTEEFGPDYLRCIKEIELSPVDAPEEVIAAIKDYGK